MRMILIGAALALMSSASAASMQGSKGSAIANAQSTQIRDQKCEVVMVCVPSGDYCYSALKCRYI